MSFLRSCIMSHLSSRMKTVITAWETHPDLQHLPVSLWGRRWNLLKTPWGNAYPRNIIPLHRSRWLFDNDSFIMQDTGKMVDLSSSSIEDLSCLSKRSAELVKTETNVSDGCLLAQVKSLPLIIRKAKIITVACFLGCSISDSNMSKSNSDAKHHLSLNQMTFDHLTNQLHL